MQGFSVGKELIIKLFWVDVTGVLTFVGWLGLMVGLLQFLQSLYTVTG